MTKQRNSLPGDPDPPPGVGDDEVCITTLRIGRCRHPMISDGRRLKIGCITPGIPIPPTCIHNISLARLSRINISPAETIVKSIPSGSSSSPSGSSGIIPFIFDAFGGNICCFGFGLLFMAIFGWSIYQGTVGAKKRKMKYLPPKMKIEGHGIKRGLTAVESAILMEQPMDKIMTMDPLWRDQEGCCDSGTIRPPETNGHRPAAGWTASI